MFTDVAYIRIKAGDGGDGAVSFLRDKFTANGGPDGGNGGFGGNIVFQGSSNVSTLTNFKYKKFFEAENGKDGSSKNRAGKSGKDLVLNVPIGTLIRNEENGKILLDISDFEPHIFACGGKGGLGNASFCTSVRQSPRFAKPGQCGEFFSLKLELKLLADVGLVGCPNVGKSTLLSTVSNAKPEIANYHFTTLSPILGVVKYSKDVFFVVADIPGLIEGAWNGVGLGHEFLRHVERCRLLLHIVDISESEGRNAISDFKTINNELLKFNPKLVGLPMIVVGNKSDLASTAQVNDFKQYIVKKGYDFFSISAKNKSGIQNLLNKVAAKLSVLTKNALIQSEENVYVEF